MLVPVGREDVAGGDGDPDVEELRDTVGDPRADGAGRADGALRVVLVRAREAEQHGADRAERLAHDPAEAAGLIGDDPGEVVEGLVDAFGRAVHHVHAGADQQDAGPLALGDGTLGLPGAAVAGQPVASVGGLSAGRP
ncbi:hypothetical protein [Actinomadura montaniterrae]|uniref:hypothetical protein n=1 Tax=Actinomadura montaniterrae TaxID=1803903 RepID=UPI00178C7ED9|nr:hypothetical protein [Actinomadura montaniterrae]